MEEKRESWVDLARVAAAAGVVVLHSAAPTVMNSEALPVQWSVANLIDSSVRWTVPVFVMLTGYLISRNGEVAADIWSGISRVRRIAPVILFWNAAFALYGILIGHPFSLSRTVLAGSFFHLWYLHMLAGLYVASPFANRLLASCTRSEGCLLSILFFLFSFGLLLVKNIPPPILAAPLFMGYYTAGHLLGSRVQVCRSTAWLVCFVGVLLTFFWTQALWAARTEYPYAIPYSYHSVATVIASVGVFALLRSSRGRFATICSRAAPAALGIYLIHPVILLPLNHLVTRWGIPGFELIVGILGFLISWIVVSQLRRVPLMRFVT